MLREFTNFVQSIFPGTDPEAARRFLEAQIEYQPFWPDFFAPQLPATPYQGDIIGNITFIVQGHSSDFAELAAPGMLLSHSCDAAEGEYVLFAACRPLRVYRNHRSFAEIRNNVFYRYFCLQNAPHIGSTVVDFGTVQSINRDVLLRDLASGRSPHVSSFTPYGYFFLIGKLTIHLLRPAAADEVRGYSAPELRDRLAAARTELGALARYVARGRR